MWFARAITKSGSREENQTALWRYPKSGANRGAGGRLAQLVERFVYTEDVGGSSPSPPTMKSKLTMIYEVHSGSLIPVSLLKT